MENIFKEKRKELGLSQRQLGEITNIHHSVIARIENDETKEPTIGIIMKLCKALQLNLYFILEYYGYTDTEYEVLEAKQLITNIKKDLLKEINKYKNNEINENDLINSIEKIIINEKII